MMVVKVMQKKHVMELKVNGQTVTIGTDDLSDLMEQAWIRQSLGLESVQKQQNEIIEAKRYRDIAIEFKDEVVRLKEALEKANRKIEMGSSVVVQETRQPGGGERIVAPISNPDRMPKAPLPPQPPQPPRPMMASQQLPEKSALDVMPNEMTEVIWNAMSPQEQGEWQQRYNMK